MRQQTFEAQDPRIAPTRRRTRYSRRKWFEYSDKEYLHNFSSSTNYYSTPLGLLEISSPKREIRNPTRETQDYRIGLEANQQARREGDRKSTDPRKLQDPTISHKKLRDTVSFWAGSDPLFFLRRPR